MNYVQTMPTYSGRGRPPKIISGKSMQTPIIGGMANPMMGTSMNQVNYQYENKNNKMSN